MKLPEPLKQINFHPQKNFFSKEKNSDSYANFSSEKPDFSLQEKFFILTSIQPIFKKKKKKIIYLPEKNSYTSPKKKNSKSEKFTGKNNFPNKNFLIFV